MKFMYTNTHLPTKSRNSDAMMCRSALAMSTTLMGAAGDVGLWETTGRSLCLSKASYQLQIVVSLTHKVN